MYVNVLLACISVHHMWAWCPWRSERVWNLLELEIEMWVTTWVLGIEPGSLGWADSALNDWASPRKVCVLFLTHLWRTSVDQQSLQLPVCYSCGAVCKYAALWDADLEFRHFIWNLYVFFDEVPMYIFYPSLVEFAITFEFVEFFIYFNRSHQIVFKISFAIYSFLFS